MSEKAVLVKLKYQYKKDAIPLCEKLEKLRVDDWRMTEGEYTDELRSILGDKFLRVLAEPMYSEEHKQEVMRHSKNKRAVEYAWTICSATWSRRTSDDTDLPRYYAGRAETGLREVFNIICVDIRKHRPKGYVLELEIGCRDEASLKEYILKKAFTAAEFRVVGFRVYSDLQDEEDWDEQ